jgi:hypothetical protein
MDEFSLQDIEQEMVNRGINPGKISNNQGMQFAGTTGRSATNNNPLNLEYRPGSYQDRYGAELEPVSKSGKQRFAKFRTMEDGYQAGLDQIRLDQSPKRKHTLASFVHKFAPPHENPTEQIIQQYARATGASPDTPLSQIPAEKLIVPMLARESSTRIVGQMSPKAQEFYQSLKNPGPRRKSTIEPYQIAAAEGYTPGPPSTPPLDVIEKEMALRGLNPPSMQDLEKEMSDRGIPIPAATQVVNPQTPVGPGGFLSPKQSSASESNLNLGATDETLSKFADPTGKKIGQFLDLPSKYLLRKPLEYIHEKVIEPNRTRTIDEWAKYVQDPGVGAAAPEAFGALPDKPSFVTPLEIALQPTLFKGLSRVGSTVTSLPSKVAEGLYASAIKIPPKVPNWMRNKIIQTGLDEGYNISQKGLDKLTNDIGTLNDQIKNYIFKSGQQGTEISGADVALRLGELRKYYSNSLPNVREKALAILDGLESQMTIEGMIPVGKAQSMKQNTYRDIKKSYEPNSGIKGPETEGMKQLARGLKEEIATKVPGVVPLNLKESELLNLLKFLDPAVNRVGNYDLIRMGDAIGTVMGGSLGGPHGAALGLMARRGLDTPAMKAKLAILLNKLGKDSFIPYYSSQFKTAAPLTAASQPLINKE